MSSRAWQLRLQDIVDAVTSIEQRTAEMTFEMFAANETVLTYSRAPLGRGFWIQTTLAIRDGLTVSSPREDAPSL